jgi:hypothetical protein
MSDKDLRKAIWQNCDPNRSLAPDNPLYEAIYERLDDPYADDPVEKLRASIEFSDGESFQLFSGFRGSGKSTELKRLKKVLEASGYTVLLADALDYINPNEPLDIVDLLTVIAAAFGEQVKAITGKEKVSLNYWERFYKFLQSEIDLKEFTLKTGADIRLALRESPSFRKSLQNKLNSRIGKLSDDVRTFVSECYAEINNLGRVVFILDSLEQIRGTATNAEEIIKSVEQTFASHLDKLALPFVHVVYTVPPWLKFTLPNCDHIEILPSVRQWNNDSARTPYNPGNEVLRRMVKRRFKTLEFPDADTNMQQIFGAASANGTFPALEIILGSCGGHFRDLLRLLRGLILTARTLPVTEIDAEKAVRTLKEDFGEIALTDARWLDRIGKERSSALVDNDGASIMRLNRALLHNENGCSF